MKTSCKRCFRILAGSSWLLLTACQSPPDPSADADEAVFFIGEVVEWVSESNYVILECLEIPPVGLRLDLARDRAMVGQVRVGSERDAPFVVADVLRGRPQVGDAAIYRPNQPVPSRDNEE